MSPMAHPTSETSILSTTRHRDTGHEPLNRLVGEHLDRLLMHYARHDDAFTVCELRDQLLKEPELEQACPETLRLRVRDRVRTLNHQGLAHQVGTQGKRRPVFKLDLGDADADVATTEPAEIPLPSSAESSEDAEAPRYPMRQPLAFSTTSTARGSDSGWTCRRRWGSPPLPPDSVAVSRAASAH
ncbi:hypothetical protein [Modicisalibacter luteus]|uniref:hypothetical protein n=1 Tax=Modicisalibacter luteus TaxID=453962 RepID=UPI003624AE02